MELLIAFLIAFGVITSNSRIEISQADAEQLVAKNNLEKEYIIFGQETDDF